MSGYNRQSTVRKRIASEAARILADLHGHHDYRSACRKAAARLGISDARQYPKNNEIEQALKDYQRLFHGKRQREALNRLRHLAFEAMQALSRFQPRLVGPVLEGTADDLSGIKLHLFAETPEDVVFALMELQIPWQDGEHRLRFRGDHTRRYPVFRFHAGESLVELVVFPLTGLRDVPLSPISDQPEERASLRQVEALLEHS